MFDRKDAYESFEALRQREREGTDFIIHTRPGRTGIVVMAPHGGEIEPGTSELARAIAGDDHGFYAFEGHKPRLNRVLHLTSTRFDEPKGASVASSSRLVLTIHGCHEDREVVYVGGRSMTMRKRLQRVLGECGFDVSIHQRLKGQGANNLCNRNPAGMGLQVEVSAGLRRTFFRDLTPRGRQRTTPRFECFVQAIREVLRWEQR